MFLSVAVPVYNAEKYIDRCVESIMAQTFRNFELILVNDGSTDLSLEKCYQWESLYPTIIRVIDKKNTGSLLTRRVCLKETSGEYIYIMDADDYLLNKNAFEIIEKTIKLMNCDLVIFNATTLKDKSLYYSYSFKNREVFENKSLEQVYDCLVEGDNLNSLWNKVFSRDLVDWNCDYNNFLYIKNGTDMFQTIPIIMNAKKIVYINEAFYFYQTNNNENSIVHKFNPQIYVSLRASYIRLYEEMQHHGVLTSEIERKLNVRYMKIASTAAYKVRLVNLSDYSFDIYNYIKGIGNDELFRRKYSLGVLGELSFGRRIIVFLLHKKMYGILFAILKLSKYLIK